MNIYWTNMMFCILLCLFLKKDVITSTTCMTYLCFTLLYGCEIWGYSDIKLIENVQNQFLRSITKLKKNTPIYMLYAELGITPIEVHIKSRMIGFWIKLVNSDDIKLCKKNYVSYYAE